MGAPWVPPDTPIGSAEPGGWKPPDTPHDSSTPASAPAPQPTLIERVLRNIPGVAGVAEFGRGVGEEFGGVFGKRQETLPSALGATLAQLVRGGYEGIAGVVEGAEKGGEALAGKGAYRPGDIAPPETTAAIANVALARLGGLGGSTSLGSDTTVSALAKALPGAAKSAATKVSDAAKSLRATPETRAERIANVAAKKVSKEISGPAAPAGRDIIEEMMAARRAGQPMTLADIDSPAIKRLAGNIYRKSDEAAKRIADFFKERNAGATGRVEDLINTLLSDSSLRATAKQLAEDRSANARPVWGKAMAGGSIAPLEHQFEREFGDATRSVTEAQQRVIEANARVTQSAGRQATGGNVYSDAGANATGRETNESLTTARGDLEKAQADRDAIRERLQKAQVDGTANAPGAVWSPRLQEFLDQPEVRQGLARGYAIERRRAVGEGKPFNPREYAILGEDEAGEPLVGQVPNMRLLAVAKEGLDSIIESDAMKDTLTGRPNKTGLSYIKLRNGFEQELDRLNPDYRAARDQWAGDTRTIRALEDGRNIFNDRRFTVEEIPEHVASLNPSERQFFLLGVADKLKSNLMRKVDAADKGSIINTEDARRRLAPLFETPQAAERFLADIERERTLKRTPTEIKGGSPTQERNVVDDISRAAWEHARRGHLGRALTASGAQGLEYLAGKFRSARQAEVNAAIARILTDPQVARQLWASGGKTEVVPLRANNFSPPQP